MTSGAGASNTLRHDVMDELLRTNSSPPVSGTQMTNESVAATTVALDVPLVMRLPSVMPFMCRLLSPLMGLVSTAAVAAGDCGDGTLVRDVVCRREVCETRIAPHRVQLSVQPLSS